MGAVGFLKGWLEGQGIAHRAYELNGLPSIVAAVGDGPATLVWNAHVDVVPAARREQFTPWRQDGRLYGRGAYDMKGALAAMLAALADLAVDRDSIPGVKVKLLIVPDEESEEDSSQPKSSEFLAQEGHLGQFVVCGEPTDLAIGVQSKGVLVLRIDVEGRAAHGSTPWLGDNAVLKAIGSTSGCCELPFASGRSPLYERPSINIGRIRGGDVVNIVPDHCRLDVDIRYLPNQDPDEVLRQVRSLGGQVTPIYELPPATLDPDEAHVRLLREAVRLAGRRRCARGRPRRRQRRRLLPRPRHPGRRVRPGRRRPPRSRGVRRDRVAGALPADPGRVRAGALTRSQSRVGNLPARGEGRVYTAQRPAHAGIRSFKDPVCRQRPRHSQLRPAADLTDSPRASRRCRSTTRAASGAATALGADRAVDGRLAAGAGAGGGGRGGLVGARPGRRRSATSAPRSRAHRATSRSCRPTTSRPWRW